MQNTSLAGGACEVTSVDGASSAVRVLTSPTMICFAKPSVSIWPKGATK
jgi:hypothetical protein